MDDRRRCSSERPSSSRSCSRRSARRRRRSWHATPRSSKPAVHRRRRSPSRARWRINLPVSCLSVTALGYHGATESALPLEPVGRQANEGIFARILHRLTGEDASGVTYHQLGGGAGPRTGALDVGAPAGTAVYAPVRGTVVSIRRPRARRKAVRAPHRHRPRRSRLPSSSRSGGCAQTQRSRSALPSRRERRRSGSSWTFRSAEEQALAEVTHDPGNHVTIEVRPAANLG